MSSVNKAILVGHLGRDCELKYTPGGAAVATLNLATTDVWTDKNQQRQERTDWHRVILWGKAAESLQEYLRKGKQIYVEGKIQNRQWDDKDGNKRYTTEIKADRVTLLGGGGASSKSRDGGSQGESREFSSDQRQKYPEQEYGIQPIPDDDSDIPFAWLLPMILPAVMAASMVA